MGVICLLSALSCHGIETENPFEVSMAIGVKYRRSVAGTGIPPSAVFKSTRSPDSALRQTTSSVCPSASSPSQRRLLTLQIPQHKEIDPGCRDRSTPGNNAARTKPSPYPESRYGVATFAEFAHAHRHPAVHGGTPFAEVSGGEAEKRGDRCTTGRRRRRISSDAVAGGLLMLLAAPALVVAMSNRSSGAYVSCGGDSRNRADGVIDESAVDPLRRSASRSMNARATISQRTSPWPVDPRVMNTNNHTPANQNPLFKQDKNDDHLFSGYKKIMA